MSRFEIIEKLVEARVAECKRENFKKYGNNDVERVNENPDMWRKHYKTYPMRSQKYPAFSLVVENVQNVNLDSVENLLCVVKN